jgi:endonuclease YncB( thermonuclease family)
VKRLFALLLLLPACALAESFVPQSVLVLDGDTVLVRRESGARPMKVRLADIDAPEKDQAFGEASRRALKEMLAGKAVRVDPVAVDIYGRLVARLYTDDGSVNAELIRRGMAWEYSFNHANREYLRLQEEARQARRGLWAGQGPVQPSQWRKRQPALHETPQPVYECGTRQHCGQIVTCDEAHYHLTRCGIKSLDPDGDGLPCDALCAAR